jgi:olefin beta-lactone synthetase
MTDSLSTRLQQNADCFPDKPVFILPGREAVTYRQLAERSDLFARGLAIYGIQPGARAALMTPPSLDFFALVFALLRTGIVPVMVDPAIGLRNVTPCLAETAPQVYFGSALTHVIRRLFGWGRASLRLNLTLADVARAGVSAPPLQARAVELENEAAIVYTSGSTGLPKGAVYTGLNFSAQIEILAQTLQLRGDEIDLPAFPLFALIDCLLGVTAVIPDMHFPPPARVDPARLASAIQAHQVDTMFASPVALTRLARYGLLNNLRLPGLKKVITAGAPTPAEVQEGFIRLLSPDANLFGVYGSTESLPVSMINSRDVLEETRHLSAKGAGICVGQPVEGMRVRIIPISDAPLSYDGAGSLPVGQTGEIAVSGPAVTKKYVSRQQANHLAKITGPDGEIIHRMGDLGYFDDQGRLWYCGRKTQRVVTAAGTLFTESIEGIFNIHPLVYRTALVGVEKAGQTEPVLWVELSPLAQGADQNQIRQELFELAKTHPTAIPIKHILFHPGFPTDVRHNSKIIREKLALLAKGRL